MLRRWLLEALLVTALVVAAVVGVQFWQSRGMARGAAPPLAGVDLAAGRPTLVVFWATWCAVCKAEMGNLEAVAQDTPLVAVAVQSGDAADVAKYLQQRGRNLAAVADPDGHVADAWRVSGVPAHYIVDGRGRVRFALVGYATEWGLRARLWWAEKFPA